MMKTPTECSVFTAAVLYDLHRRGASADTGLTLAVDLDRAGACICRRETDGSVTELWSHPGIDLPPFFPALARHIAPEYPEPEALSAALYAAAPGWARAQRSFIRNPQTELSVPPVMAQTPEIPIKTLAELFESQWAGPIRQTLDAAWTQLQAMAQPTPRILPFGTLARLFSAEYLIRQRLSPGAGALLPMPALAACASDEDPAGFVDAGRAIRTELAAKARSLDAALMLQVHRRSPDGLVSELLTLAEQDTPYDRLRQVRYSAPILVDAGEPLVIFSGSNMHRFPLPRHIFGDGQASVRLQVGLGLQDDAPALMLQLPDGSCTALPANLT